MTKNIPTAKYLFLVLIFSLFTSETLIMLLIKQLPVLSEWQEALVDSTFLLIINFPIIYYFAFLPLTRFGNLINKKQEDLHFKNIELEEEIYANKIQFEHLMQLKLALDHLSSGIIITNIQRKIIYINPSAVKLFQIIEYDINNLSQNYSADDLIGLSIDLFHSNPEQQNNLLPQFFTTYESVEFMGSRIVNIKFDPMFDESGKQFGFVAEWNDITEVMLKSDENEMLINQVNHMQKMESLSRLTSGIAHDFNNILGAIAGYNELTKLIAEECQDPQRKEEILFNTNQVDIASKRAVKLIKQMMMYSRQNITKNEIEIRPTHEVIDEVVSMVRPALTSIFELIVKVDSGLTIKIDSTSLHQILTNLIINSRDAMKKGGIITLRLKKITLQEYICTACAQKLEIEFIELSVTDNGTGIEQDIIDKIFDPFFTTKAVGEGTGLGLSTVSTMVHEVHGHVLVESRITKPKRGTTFRLLFPK
jgi:signal transduction histidine kinase